MGLLQLQARPFAILLPALHQHWLKARQGNLKREDIVKLAKIDSMFNTKQRPGADSIWVLARPGSSVGGTANAGAGSTATAPPSKQPEGRRKNLETLGAKLGSKEPKDSL